MIKVYDAADPIDAQLVCDWLRAHHLQAETRGQYLSGATGELPPGNLCSVWIAEPRHKDLARQLIEQLEADRLRSAQPRPCPACGELCESQFELCWSCGASLPPAEQ